MMVVFFGDMDTAEDGTEGRINQSNIILAYAILFLDPLSDASGTILMRNLKSLEHPLTVEIYTSVSSVPCMIGLSLLTGQSLAIIKEFRLVDYINLMGASVFYIISMRAYFIQLSSLPAPVIQPLSQSAILLTVAVDAILFHVDFTLG